MRVLLVRPFSIVFTKPYFTAKPPINLGYLSGFLKHNGHEVKILDFGLTEDLSSIDGTIKVFDPHIVGVNAFTQNVLDGFDLIKKIKSINSNCFTVMGGPHSTSIPEETLKECSDLDFVAIGEGEVTLLELCNALERKNDVSKVAGICYRHDGKIIRTSSRALIYLFLTVIVLLIYIRN